MFLDREQTREVTQHVRTTLHEDFRIDIYLSHSADGWHVRYEILHRDRAATGLVTTTWKIMTREERTFASRAEQRDYGERLKETTAARVLRHLL